MAQKPIVVRIDGAAITDNESFHSQFAHALGFPDFYGRNMDAWIDCLSYLDDPTARMTSVHVAPGAVVTILIENAEAMKRQCPNEFQAMNDCAAFVNYRRASKGKAPVLSMAYYA